MSLQPTNQTTLVQCIDGTVSSSSESCPSTNQKGQELNAPVTLKQCTSPYIEWKRGECCLDKNNNAICDSDETKAEPAKSSKQEIIQQSMRKVVKIVITTSGMEVLGSGFVVSDDGYIVTNNHVIEPFYDLGKLDFCDPREPDGCAVITVTFKDGSEYSDEQVRLVGRNVEHDIALLKLNSQSKFEYFDIEKTYKVSNGDSVFALGSPKGFEFSATNGVISARNRPGLVDESITKYFQTDAAVNQGNSGGPLINEEGKVVGLSTWGLAPWYAEGLNFALEPDTIAEFVASLKQIKADFPGYSCKKAQDESLRYVCQTEPVQGEIKNKTGKLTIPYLEFDVLASAKKGSDLVKFNSFSPSISNKGIESVKVCFKVKVIENGFMRFDKVIDTSLEVKPNNVVKEKIPVNLQTSSIGDSYFEINLFNCNNQTEQFGTFYYRLLDPTNVYDAYI